MSFPETIRKAFYREPEGSGEPENPGRDSRYFNADGTPTDQLLKVRTRLLHAASHFQDHIEGFYIVGSNRTGENRRGGVDETSDLDILVLFADYRIPHDIWPELDPLLVAVNEGYSPETGSLPDGRGKAGRERRAVDTDVTAVSGRRPPGGRH